MTYRGNMPPGLYDAPGQGQQPLQPLQPLPLPPHPHPQQRQQQQQQQHQQQQHRTLYPNSYPNGSPHFQSAPSVQQYPQPPAYPQQTAPAPTPTPAPAPLYPLPTSQFSYDGAFSHHAPPSTVAPVQFVDPSFLQQQPPLPRQPTYVPPAPAPTAARVSAPAPAPAPTPVTAAQPAPTMAGQSSRVAQPQSQPQRPQQQTPSAQNSPRLDERRPPSQAGSGKLPSKDPRRLVSTAGVAKTNASPQAAPHAETLPLLISVAEDCFDKANAANRDVALSMSAQDVTEHHKLVATGLGCLEVAMQSKKLWPRLEARICLRYANILIEETSNISEAERALSKGIAVCEKHHFVDLKYSSQFLLMKTLFQRNQKAAFKSIESHIADCTTYKHIHWVYAFRFLKASFHLQSGTQADHHALENLKRIASIANQREDKAIYVMAQLLEGLAHLSSKKDDWITRVQTCIAEASKLQLDAAVHLPQMDVLLLLLDLACSLYQKSNQISSQKLTFLQTRLEELKHSPDWTSASAEVLLPIARMPNGASTISNDTRAVLRPGEHGIDYLVLTTLGKQEAFALTFVFHGIVALSKATTVGRSSTLWAEAIRLLDDFKHLQSSQSLPEALKQTDWATELICYAHILVGLQAATLSEWAKVKTCLELIRDAQPPAGFLDIMTLYLSGVFAQGVANLHEALGIWKDPRFALQGGQEPKHNPSHPVSILSILAALNRLWIMQEPSCKNDGELAELAETLHLLCEDNPDPEIRTAYHLVLASCKKLPGSIQQVKRHIQQGLGGAQQTSNTQFLSIALNVMRCRLFENVVGEQTVKSAKAGCAQARKSGNLLWMSVAEGMLAKSYFMMGLDREGSVANELGTRLANESFEKTKVQDQ